MKLYKISVNLTTKSMTWNHEELEAKETKHSFLYDKRRINKDRIMKIDSIYYNTIGGELSVLSYYTYCLEKQRKEAVTLLLARIQKRISDIKTDALLMYNEAFKESNQL